MGISSTQLCRNTILQQNFARPVLFVVVSYGLCFLYNYFAWEFEWTWLLGALRPPPKLPWLWLHGGSADPCCWWGSPSTFPRQQFEAVLPFSWFLWPSGYGSIPIHTIFRGMNIHLPAIFMFTRGIGFWPIPISISGRFHRLKMVEACWSEEYQAWRTPTFFGAGRALWRTPVS